MAYLGNAPARSFISFERQVFTIVNSQTAYTLSHSVTNENDIRLVVNNVVQEPGSGKAYTATGTALTLSAALTNGTDEMYCVFLGRATATNAPGAGSVGTSQLADLNVTSGKIANDAVTLAKMASGTDGNIISYDASGNPVAVATGSAGQILTSAGAGAPPTFAAAGINTPAFEAYKPSNQDISDATYTKVSFATQLFDITNVYDADVYSRFTPGITGKYNLYAQIMFETPGGHEVDLAILAFYKNGSRIKYGKQDLANDSTITTTITCSTVVDSDTNDYFEVFAYLDRTSGGTIRLIGDGSDGQTCSFGAYRIIT